MYLLPYLGENNSLYKKTRVNYEVTKRTAVSNGTALENKNQEIKGLEDLCVYTITKGIVV